MTTEQIIIARRRHRKDALRSIKAPYRNRRQSPLPPAADCRPPASHKTHPTLQATRCLRGPGAAQTGIIKWPPAKINRETRQAVNLHALGDLLWFMVVLNDPKNRNAFLFLGIPASRRSNSSGVYSALTAASIAFALIRSGRPSRRSARRLAALSALRTAPGHKIGLGQPARAGVRRGRLPAPAGANVSLHSDARAAARPQRLGRDSLTPSFPSAEGCVLRRSFPNKSGM